MSWDAKADVKPEETKVEPEKTAEPAKEEAAKPQEGEQPQAEQAPKEPEKFVPQEILGKVLKAQREKFKTREVEKDEEIRILKEKVDRLEASTAPTYQVEEQDSGVIEQKVREEFLKRQDALGFEKYGDQYKEALELISIQRDPVLVKKIYDAASPAEAVMREAMRIANELQYGATPEERERKKEAEIKEKLRKEIEAELLEKLKVKNNQPTDVQNLRAAGSTDYKPVTRDTWASGRSSLPK